MGTLGDFGVERAAVDETFGWFGTEIRVHPDLSDVAVVDLFATVSSVNESTPAADAMAAIGHIGRILVHEDDADTFWTLAKKNRQTMEDIVRLAMAILEALSGRPTELPSDSSDGQRTTTTRSEADSSSRTALRLLEGRPDLQAAVVMAERERQTASAG